MPGYTDKGRSRMARVQASGLHKVQVCYALIGCVLLAGCGSDPMNTPLDLFHDLEGGQIAAERPPPPGVGQPYPHIGTVPAKPVMPDPAFRNALRNELTAERDRREILAADTPIEKITPPPPPAPPAPVPAAPSPAAGAPAAAPDAEETTANAVLPGAEAPPPPAKPATPAPPPAPPKDAALQLVGDPIDTPGLPLVPDAPPAPATFEGVPAEPAPTVSTMPRPLPPPDGTRVFFPTGAATLPPSQMQTLKDVVSHRKAQTIEITGLGDAESDTPEGQEAAIDLALQRARAVADAFSALHVPQASLRIAARPYGRGAVVSLLP